MPRRRAVVLSAVVLFAAIFGAWTALADPVEGIGFLYVIPVALVAVEFGAGAGLIAAATAVALLALGAATEDLDLGAGAYLTRGTAMVAVGVLVGHLSTRRRRLEEATARWFDMSNALLAVASLDGYLTRLNPHWETVLGYPRAELMARPYAELVHPDDLDRSRLVAGVLAGGPSSIVDFENRFRTKDGAWRWLLWSARSDGQQIYAVATDLTDRKQLEAERDTLLARVEALARTDELTGLPNRRSWDEELRREVARAARHGHPVCVAMLDMDAFKAYNDTHGHPAGDALLREAAAAWRTTIRVTDFIARYGGEEFAVLLPEVQAEQAAGGLVERLRAATPEGQTCSAGLACWDGDESPESLVARADAALYEAKRTGRNRAVVAS